MHTKYYSNLDHCGLLTEYVEIYLEIKIDLEDYRQKDGQSAYKTPFLFRKCTKM